VNDPIHGQHARRGLFRTDLTTPIDVRFHKFDGKRVVITGASSGIGVETASAQQLWKVTSELVG
jgi:hypothetical protein